MRDYLIQTSVQLHVNFADLPFTADRDEAIAQRATERVTRALERSGDTFAYLLPAGMDEQKKRKYTEQGLMHRDTNASPYSVFYLRMDEKLSVQTALSDHAVIGSWHENDLQMALLQARRIRQQIAGEALLARDEEYGYLTAQPCDAGTGMRAAALVHVPMLHLTHQMDKMTKMLSQKGIILRPFSEDKTKSFGALSVIENRYALGKNAQERAQEVMHMADEVLVAERNCRQVARDKGDVGIYDAVWRAYGIARYARRITCMDARNLWSSLTLGNDIGAYEIAEDALNDLWELSCGKRPGEVDEMGNPDVLRAQRVRFLLNGGN